MINHLLLPSGIRFGTPAITTRGLKEKDMILIVDLIDRVIKNSQNLDEISRVKVEVNKLMKGRLLFN
jgi:glycine hydroxymethyltransferase